MILFVIRNVFQYRVYELLVEYTVQYVFGWLGYCLRIGSE